MISGRTPTWESYCVVRQGLARPRCRHWPPRSSLGSIKRDYEVKREEYLAYGLLEYWIVDPLKRSSRS